MAQQYTIRDAARNLAAAELFRKFLLKRKVPSSPQNCETCPMPCCRPWRG